MKQKGNFKYLGISYFLVLLIVFCMVGSCSAGNVKPIEEESVKEEKGTDTEITVVDENSIQKPTWKVGDSWCTGYTIDFSEMEDEMRSDFSSSMGKINRLEVRGEIGVYQSARVVKDDVVVKIADTDYTCYKVSFEQYMGGAFTMDYDIEMEIPDLFSYEEDDYSYGDFRSSSGSSYETTTMKMKYYMYMKMKGDVIGNIYYTISDLAVAKESFNQKLDGEVEMDMDAKMGRETYMDMATEFNFLNVRSEYDVEYNPPLDIFNFPIVPDEYWTASSMMTTTLNKISGRIIYNVKSTGTEYPDTAMNDDIDLNQEISTPDTYGPVRVTYYFYNPGTKSINLLEGITSECIIIEPDEDYWYHDYEDYSWSDTDSDGKANIDEYMEYETSESTLIPYGGIGADDFDAESLESPIETSANSVNYYSEDKGNIISYEPSEDSSNSITSVPYATTYTSSENVNIAEPKTYSQVNTFKTEDRENYISKYSRSSGGGGVEDDSTWTLIIASITIAFLVFIVVIAAMKISKKKRVQQMTQNYIPPSQARDPQPQDPYSQTPSYSRPPTLQSPQQPPYQPPYQPSHQSPHQPSHQSPHRPSYQPSYQASPQQPQDYGSYEPYGTQQQYPARTDYHHTTPTMAQQPQSQPSTYQSPNYPDYNEPYDPRPKYDYNPSEYNYDPYIKNRNY